MKKLADRIFTKSVSATGNQGITIIHSESGLRGAFSRELLETLGYGEIDFDSTNKGKKKFMGAVDPKEKELLFFPTTQEVTEATTCTLSGTFNRPMLYASGLLRDAIKVAKVDIKQEKSVKFNSVKFETDEELKIPIIIIDLKEADTSKRSKSVDWFDDYEADEEDVIDDVPELVAEEEIEIISE